MSALVAFLAATAIGYVLRTQRVKQAPSEPRATMLALRPAVTRPGEAYRDAAAETACTLAELHADLIAAGLPVTARMRDFLARR